MTLDLLTLLVASVLVAATAGGLLLLSWLYNRHVPALAIWGGGFLSVSLGIGLVSARGVIPDLLSIMGGNALLALSYGLIWSGIRKFEGRRVSILATLAGAAVWLLGCQVDAIYDSMTARVILMAGIVSAYTALNVYELWHAQEPAAASRWPIIVLLVAHAALFLLRIPVASTLSLPLAPDDEHVTWLSLIILESLFTIFCLCYLLASLARERIMLMYKRDALVDSLTGIVNRRGFIERGERLLRRASLDNATVVLLLFDLDHFKSINDSFGHQAGDRALKHFSMIATEALRPADLFGRLGGEEFGCMLYDSSLRRGMQVAERVRAAVAATPFDIDDWPLRVTVSVGVASTSGDTDLPALMKEADLALYRAKAKGRNRVEPPPMPVAWQGRLAAG